MPIKYKKHYICDRIVLDMPDELQKDIILFNQGEKSAFERLYNRYWAQVYNFTGIYINNSVEKEDIVQQTFLKLWELKGKLDPEKGIEGLLFIMTRNQIFNFTHKGVNEAAMKEALMNLKEESSNELEEQIEAQELEKYIDTLVELLPPRQKEAFLLSRKNGMTYKEISKIMGISEKGVEQNIYLALKFLRINLPLILLFFTG